MAANEKIHRLRTWGKRAVGRAARVLLPRKTISLAHVEPGLRLKVDLRRNLMFWWGGLSRFEPYSVSVYRAAIRPGDTIIDVGANVGFFTTLFSRLVQSNGQVLAFEPDPENLKLLRSNVAALGEKPNVTIVACAVGSEVGTANFSLDEATGATGHLGGTSTLGGMLYGDGKLRVLETPVETIDGVVHRMDLEPTVIKLDIEGGEFDALRGATTTIATYNPIIVSELGGEGGTQVMQFLFDRDYRIWNLETGRSATSLDDPPAMIVAVHETAIGSERGQGIQRVLQTLAS